MRMRTKLNDFRFVVKDEICAILVDIYKKQNNGLLPNWEEDEEIVVEDKVNDNCHLNIWLIEGNTFDDRFAPMYHCFDKFVVTLDYNLYLYSYEDDVEYEWTDIGTDDLIRVYEMLQTFKESL